MKQHELRVIDEKHELDGKISKLDYFIQHSEHWENLEDADKDLLNEQYNSMIAYSRVLGLRIDRFKS